MLLYVFATYICTHFNCTFEQILFLGNRNCSCNVKRYNIFFISWYVIPLCELNSHTLCGISWNLDAGKMFFNMKYICDVDNYWEYHREFIRHSNNVIHWVFITKTCRNVKITLPHTRTIACRENMKIFVA